MGFLDDVLKEVKPGEEAGEEHPEEKPGEEGTEGEGTDTSAESGEAGKKRMHAYSPEFEAKFGQRKD